MPLVIAGIDEAGYGPLLGPLTVGMTAFQLDHWDAGQPAPNLWKTLSRAVCKQASDKRRRIAVNDSKKLKLANSNIKKHPLTHLERGVLAFESTLQQSSTTDSTLFEATGVTSPDHPWYRGVPLELPLGADRAEIELSTNALRRAMTAGGVRTLALRCAAVDETRFNEIVRETGTKASVTGRAIADHLRHAWHEWGGADMNHADDSGVRVVCDRQGGRTAYSNLLRGALPDAELEILEESPARSRYLMRAPDRSRAMTILFMPQAEEEHLPVALASMLAKLTRELLMTRFNRYWIGRMPELKPTAGYRQDANRWLEDAAGVVTDTERNAMIRTA